MSLRLRVVVACAAAAVLAVGGGQVASGAPTELFISEYVEGTSNNKAIEIYNGTGAPISLFDVDAGVAYSVQMFFNGSSSPGLTISLSGTIAPGDVFVLAHNSAGAPIQAVADMTSGGGWFNGNDAVTLRRNGVVIDSIGQIGFDPVTEWGTGLTSTQDNTLRRKGTIQAGDANATDPFDPAVQWNGFALDTFDGLGSHTLDPGDAAPAVASTNPSGGATGVALDSNIDVTFTEPVTVTGSWYSITCTTSGTHTAAVTGGPTTFTLNPDTNFAGSETCNVSIVGAQVSDQDANDPPDTMAANHSFSFATLAPAPLIGEIQGAAHISPRNGQGVSGVEGIVTAKRTLNNSAGFWIQDAGDGNAATSDGIFVFTRTNTAASVGQLVRVNGTVSEFRPGGSSGPGLTITQLVSPTFTVVSSGNTVPAPVSIGMGGRMPPAEVIDDDTSGSVETGPTTFDPANDGIDFWESLEGMLVRANNGAVVNETESFGEITLLPDNGVWASGIRTPRGGILARSDYGDFNPERFIVDDEILRDAATPPGGPRPSRAMPVMNVGDQIVGSVAGPLDYSFNNFKIQALAAPTFLSSDLQPETTAQPIDQELAAGTFNVENLDPSDGAAFDRLAHQIVDNLRSPDLLGIEEIQDNNGTVNDGTVDASQTWEMLVAAIQAAGGPHYEYRQIDPVNNHDGGVPGGNIRVGFLFRTDRGLSFIDRPGGDSVTPTTIVSTPSGPQLSLSPGRVAPDDPAFFETRKSLAGEFRWHGKKLFVVVNHFSSKNDDQPLMGRFQPPTRFTEGPRHGQAAAVKEFVDDILAADRTANVIVLGDINDFEFSETVEILEGDDPSTGAFDGELYSAIKELPANERYSYVFEGNSQVLDQILLSRNIYGHFPYTYDVVHVNSEFAGQASDHEPSLVRIRMTGRPTPKP